MEYYTTVKKDKIVVLRIKWIDVGVKSDKN